MVLAASMFVNLKLYSLIEINFSKIINKSLWWTPPRHSGIAPGELASWVDACVLGAYS
jgi:hypothetical protein